MSNPFLSHMQPVDNNRDSIPPSQPQSNTPSNPFNPFTNPLLVSQTPQTPVPNTGNPFNPFISTPLPPAKPPVSAAAISEFDPFAPAKPNVQADSPKPAPLTSFHTPNNVLSPTSPHQSIPSVSVLENSELPPPYAGPFPPPPPGPPPQSAYQSGVSNNTQQNPSGELDERLAIQLALDPSPDNLQAQLKADEEYARRLSADLGGYDPKLQPVSGSVRPVPARPAAPAGGNGTANLGGDSESTDDADLARILQEEEDAAYAQTILDQERKNASSQYNPYSVANNTYPSGRRSSYNTPNHAYAAPGSYPQVNPYVMHGQQSSASGYSSNGPQYGYASHSPSPYDTMSFYPGAVGKPGHSNAFPPEVNGATYENRFNRGEYRDLDVCFWGSECVTVMERDVCLFYVNLAGNQPGTFGPSSYLKWENLSLQRHDAEGPVVFIMRESAKGKTFQIFDTTLKKAISCHKTRTAQLTFSTITNSEKLVWQDGEMRVQQGGLFTTKKSGASDLDLHAYVVRELYEAGLRRTRIRVGGRGLGKVELIVGSWIGFSLLTTV
ncbi:hypothetical protein HDU81_005512 [Chytriomyces hyalinus]|nr:hypothetical protein HDU81_005512 [Chytriomyces hyalinus]